MKMKQLYTFRVVCEEESITKAAERLSTTQPAISRTISELEDSVGVRLFDRSSRKVVLNETGQLFLSKVIPLLELYEDLENTFQDNGSMSVLRLALLRLLSIPFCLEY
ncbi:LysR family transcriptional regulator [Clostridium sp. AM58-1XD]|uniref:LysR family transcriptional regulator n=1 Tax=Clostridium sp. AM58-1XD TaxID=2292307 RepID=UPI0015F6B478|nr:LysR family transcriptional regulator [Clostridium sp. AM58-1XD]